jgi:hypothetical protein
MPPLQYDVVFYDEVGSVFQEDTPNRKGIGGSELGIITLSQELARNGFSVLVLNDPISRETDQPSPDTPIAAPSGVHYASFRSGRPAIECSALIVQRYSGIPTDVEARRTVLWLHDSCGGRGDAVAERLREVTRKLPSKGGPVPVFVSEWQKDTYPPEVVGRYWKVIPNMLPRLVFDARWTTTPQEDTMVFASATARGLEATLAAWADPRVRKAGTTVLEVMGPSYDPPPEEALEDPALADRVRVLGSLPLPGLLERLAASRGLVFANTWPETFCLLVAYSEAMGKPARFIALSPYGVAGVKDTMVNAKRFLYRSEKDWDRFITDLASEISGAERLTVDPVKGFHPETILPLWYEALAIEP